MQKFSLWVLRHPRVGLALLLSAPLLWLVVAYLGSLAVMLVSAFWSVDSFTGAVQHVLTFNNFQTLASQSVYRVVAVRSITVAVLVTVFDALVAVPVALFIAKVLPAKYRNWAVVLVVLPLWASYLVKTYAWRTLFADGGVLDWALAPLGLHAPSYGLLATTVTLAYLWFPYMALPVYAAVDKLPDSLLEASGDLGASPWQTVRHIVLPMVYPALIAGAIFTFSLTLGDYIVVKIVGGKTQLFANIVFDNIGTAGNLPFAAAAATVPIVTVVGFLFLVRRTGALENL
mgnify:CR=1 FL=1